MTMLFMDGFDHYSTGDLGQMWDAVVGCSIVSTPTRFGTGQALAIGDNAQSVNMNYASFTTFVVGAGFYFNSVTGTDTNNNIIFLDDVGNGKQVIIRLTLLGELEILNGNLTLLASSPVSTIVANNYYYIEFKGTISTSVAANSCQLRVNENVVATVPTSSSIQNTGHAYYNRVGFSSNGPISYLDDVYICDQSGAVNNDFLGDSRVIPLYPNGNGDSSQWTNSIGNSTNNYTYVDDATPNGDTDYVKASSINLVDLYTFDSLTATTVFGIEQCSYARKDAAGTRHFQQVQKVGGTVYTASTATLLDTYTYYKQVIELNPDTSSAWTDTDINSAQFGVKTVT
jgi:hypothetical protein